MNARWARQFLGMLKTMQQLGSQGSSREVILYADGDGDFRPKFEWDENSMAALGIEPAAPRVVQPHEKLFFDAG